MNVSSESSHDAASAYSSKTKTEMDAQPKLIQNSNNVADHHIKPANQNQKRKRDDEDEENIASAANTNTSMVQWQWRGNTVPKKEAKALRHVFDDLQDHFGYQRNDPRVRFNSTGLTRVDRHGTWFGDLDFTYDINGEHCNIPYIGMDVVDLAPKLVHKLGQPLLKDYGETWVYCYLPHLIYEKFKSYLKAGTGWDVSDEGTVHDPNRNLVAIEAKMRNKSGQPRPSFWVTKDKGTSASGSRDIAFSRIGTVQDVNSQSSHQRIHRGVGIFSVSMEVEGTPNFKPSPRMGDEADLCFTLVSLRSWGITDAVAPIVHAPRRRDI